MTIAKHFALHTNAITVLSKYIKHCLNINYPNTYEENKKHWLCVKPGTGNGMQGRRGMGGMLYSGECRQIFRGVSLNIPGNVLKHSMLLINDSMKR